MATTLSDIINGIFPVDYGEMRELDRSHPLSKIVSSTNPLLERVRLMREITDLEGSSVGSTATKLMKENTPGCVVSGAVIAVSCIMYPLQTMALAAGFGCLGGYTAGKIHSTGIASEYQYLHIKKNGVNDKLLQLPPAFVTKMTKVANDVYNLNRSQLIDKINEELSDYQHESPGKSLTTDEMRNIYFNLLLAKMKYDEMETAGEEDSLVKANYALAIAIACNPTIAIAGVESDTRIDYSNRENPEEKTTLNFHAGSPYSPTYTINFTTQDVQSLGVSAIVSRLTNEALFNTTSESKGTQD